MKKLIAFAFFLLVSYSLHAQQSSSVISYQGMIKDTNGAVVKDSSYPITVLIWTDVDGGTPIWQDVFLTEVTGGVFNILLGSQTPLPASSLMDHPIWISVSIGGFSESSQRSRLSAVPMALNVVDNAITSAKIADSSVTTSKLADSSITASKINMNYVSTVSVNGQVITGSGTNLNLVSGNGINLTWDPSEGRLLFSTNEDTSVGSKGGHIGRSGGMETLSVGDTIAFWRSGVAIKGTSGPINQVLHGDGGVAPTWGPVNLATDVSGLLDLGTYADGVLPLAYGGTNNIPAWSALEGVANSAGNNSSVVAGGAANNADNVVATIGGGFNNNCFGKFEGYPVTFRIFGGCY